VQDLHYPQKLDPGASAPKKVLVDFYNGEVARYRERALEFEKLRQAILASQQRLDETLKVIQAL
jgi:hypothetical protein